MEPGSQEPAIVIEGLWKRYGLPPAPSIKSVLRNLRSGKSPLYVDENQGPWSLIGIDLEVKKGEVIGIIGRNGAGKSTLLKVLAGVSPASRGRVVTRGRIFPMIELSAGMHMDLTGRENVHLLGAVMGIPHSEMRDKVSLVEEFCELGEWFDRPVFQYSSGMIARLGFGVAMNIDADILLVDEVLSVGDFIFQKKALNKMTSLINSGVTVVLVSHSPYMVERICNKVIFLKSGKVESIGEPAKVFSDYYNLADSDESKLLQAQMDFTRRPGTGDIRATSIEVIGSSGIVADSVFTGEPFSLKINVVGYEDIENLSVGIKITDEFNTTLVYLSNLSLDSNSFLKIARGPGAILCFLQSCLLQPGKYSIHLKLSCSFYKLDIWDDALILHVKADPSVTHQTGGLGLVYCKSSWSYKEGCSK